MATFAKMSRAEWNKPVRGSSNDRVDVFIDAIKAGDPVSDINSKDVYVANTKKNIDAIKNTQLILINGNKDESFEKKIIKISNKVKIFYSKYLPSNIQEFSGKRLLAFAGIACLKILISC